MVEERFLFFRNYSNWIDSIWDQITDITIELFYITEDDIDMIKSHDFDKKIDININYGYVAKIKSKLLECTKYINIDKIFFDTIYDKIKKMDFENIVLNSYSGDDGGFLEITIGLEKWLNKYYKEIRLWCPPCTKDEKTLIQIKKILEIYDTIREKLKYEEWYDNVLKKEYELFKEKNEKK
jgi:hypothetical protein